MKLANGRSSSFLGCGKMTIGLGDQQLVHTICVAEIEPERILGLDFLRQYDGQLVLKDGCYELQFGNLSEATHGQPLTPSCFRVSVENPAVVPPRSEALVAGKIVGQYAPVLGLLEPTARLMEVNQFIDFADVFAVSSDDLGHNSLVTHQIDTGSSHPIRQPVRRLPLHKQAEADTLLKDMLKKGVIEPSSSPWTSPIVSVKKKDGSTRFCMDYCKLNEVTVEDSYPLPRIDDCLDALAGCR